MTTSTKPDVDALIAPNDLTRLFISSTLASMLLPLNSTMIAVALLDIGREFDASPHARGISDGHDPRHRYMSHSTTIS